MNKYISALCALVIGTLLLTSCLGTSDDSDIVYYNDTAITSFTLTSVTRIIHTTSKSGKDSVYRRALSNPVTFSIDQNRRKVYNLDSLFADCDLSHVLVSIGTKNNGYVAIKSLTSDTLYNYSSTDSLDFSKPREIRVYANDGSGYRAYEVVVNKHQTETGKLIWEKKSAESYPVDEVKAKWEKIVASAGLARFIGAGTKEAYAYNQQGQLVVTKDEGATWTVDELDDDMALLPKESIAFVSHPYSAIPNTDYQLLAGVIKEGEVVCSVWRKIAEYGENSKPGKWAYVPFESYNRYNLPAMSDFSLVWFHGNVLAIDSNWIRITRDGGITWKTSESMQLPANASLSAVEAMTDKEGALWLKDKSSGEVWRGILVE
jgi:hypothetical protein